MHQPYTIEQHRHTMAHILAQALLRLYPDAKLGIGPVVDNGFYYEVDVENKITENDLKKIENEMISIAKENLPVTQINVSKDEAYNLLLHQGQIYKTEILEEIQANEVSLFKTGEEFFDLCSGPHVARTGHVGFFKLTKIEEGYWKGKPSRPIMQKIFGIGFIKKDQLEKYFEAQQILKQKDHRILGPKLGYYQIFQNANIELPIWLPKGKIVRNIIVDKLREEKSQQGFDEIETTCLIPVSPEFISLGSENIQFGEIKNNQERYILRIETTPLHYQFYKLKTRSYRELPIRVYETGYLFRNEYNNELYGLKKNKIFTADSNNIFCTEEQLFEELIFIYNLTTKILTKFGLKDYIIQLSTNSENTDKRFKWADNVLRKVVESLKLSIIEIDDKYTENGPKIELFVKDIFGKEWQISSIQLDIFSTIKHNLSYITSTGTKKEVVVIHVTFIGSLERFISLLIEHTEGNLPIWLSPIQARVLPISKKYNSYTDSIVEKLTISGYRIDSDKKDETLQARIKIAEDEKIPYMLIVGSKEEDNNSISVRPREKPELGLLKLEEFINLLKEN